MRFSLNSQVSNLRELAAAVILRDTPVIAILVVAAGASTIVVEKALRRQ